MSLIEKVLPPLTTGRTIVDALGNVLDLGIRLYISKVFFLSGLTFVNIMVVVSYWHFLNMAEPALAQHVYWGVLILFVLLHGPGKTFPGRDPVEETDKGGIDTTYGQVVGSHGSSLLELQGVLSLLPG